MTKIPRAVRREQERAEARWEKQIRKALKGSDNDEFELYAGAVLLSSTTVPNAWEVGTPVADDEVVVGRLVLTHMKMKAAPNHSLIVDAPYVMAVMKVEDLVSPTWQRGLRLGLVVPFDRVDPWEEHEHACRHQACLAAKQVALTTISGVTGAQCQMQEYMGAFTGKDVRELRDGKGKAK